MNKITDERLTELVIDLTGNLQRADTSLAVSAAPYFAEVKRRFADVLSALNELQALRAGASAAQVLNDAREAQEEIDRNAVTVRYDLSPAAHESAIQRKLTELGWKPPEETKWPDAQITKVHEVFLYPDPPETIKAGDSLCIDERTGRVRRAGPHETSFATAAEDIVSREIELRPGGWAFNKADTGCGACNDGCPETGCRVEKESPPVQQPVNAPCNHCGLRHDGLCDARRNAQQAASVPEEIRDNIPRALELAERLVASGPKCCAVSASETHEISDFIQDVCNWLAAAPEAHPDNIAVDKFAAAMKAKMAKQRAKGYSGWDDESRCPVERLQSMLVEHVAKGDPVDVGNFAMMLFNREARTSDLVGARVESILSLFRRSPQLARHAASVPAGWKLVPNDYTAEWIDKICEQTGCSVFTAIQAIRNALIGAPEAPKPAIPDVLFDGYAVLQELSPQAKKSTSAEQVSWVLDAVVRLIRKSGTS